MNNFNFESTVRELAGNNSYSDNSYAIEMAGSQIEGGLTAIAKSNLDISRSIRGTGGAIENGLDKIAESIIEAADKDTLETVLNAKTNFKDAYNEIYSHHALSLAGKASDTRKKIELFLDCNVESRNLTHNLIDAWDCVEADLDLAKIENEIYLLVYNTAKGFMADNLEVFAIRRRQAEMMEKVFDNFANDKYVTFAIDGETKNHVVMTLFFEKSKINNIVVPKELAITLDEALKVMNETNGEHFFEKKLLTVKEFNKRMGVE